jgi:hypothetical protein
METYKLYSKDRNCYLCLFRDDGTRYFQYIVFLENLNAYIIRVISSKRVISFVARKAYQGRTAHILTWMPREHSPPLDPLLSQLNRVHIVTHPSFKIHFSIIFPPTCRAQMVFSLKDIRLKYCISFAVPRVCHMSRQSHLHLWGKGYSYEALLASFPSSSYYPSLRSMYYPEHLILKQPQSVLPRVKPSLTPIQNKLN